MAEWELDHVDKITNQKSVYHVLGFLSSTFFKIVVLCPQS